STGMAVMLSNKGNAMATATAVKAKVRELERFFPQGLKWASPYDTSLFVGLSINEVVHTLFEAMVLVFIVMLVFLQNIRYTLIPAVVVPISLLGAFAGIWYLGMSINVLTMFAMVLVIGIVVDDAIVVVENVERIMDEEGLPPREATKKAMHQISGAVVGITAVLVSVFIPLAMFSGATGNIYRQFALTMAIAIAFSAFFALSLTPALCATLLKPEAEMQRAAAESKFWRIWPMSMVPAFFGWFNGAFKSTTRSYQGTVARSMRHAGWLMAVYLAVTAVALWMYTRIPTSFLPNEDQGALLVMAQLPPGATKERTDATMTVANGVIKSMPEVENFVNVSGFSFAGSGQNMAMGFIALKDWALRHGKGQDAASLAGRITGALMGTVKDGYVLAINPPPIPEIGISAGFSFYLQDRSDSGHDALIAKRDELIAKMRQNPVFDASSIRASGLEDAPQLRIDIDRRTAAAQGVSFASVSNTLGVALGSAYVSDFPNQGRLQRVIVQADADARMQPEEVLAMTVPNSQGTGVPLSTIASAQWVTGTQQSVRVNGYPSKQIDGQAATGYSSGDAMAEVLRLVDELGGGYSVEWTGQSREEIKGSAQTVILYAFAILSVFLALAALYESWSIPLAVMLVVPLGFFGMVLGVTGRNFVDGMFFGMPPSYLNDIYFHVGMITVIGLSAKNAILIIEFAKDAQDAGK
ncbi:MAG: efflux RND transporter permease subunit, partial [Ottowia sp.]|nr:efflux RND transporter permease subunit [Ottowia sp.]